MDKTEKITLVVGASEKTDRYSNKAIRLLLENGFNVIGLGNREGKVENVSIFKNRESFKNIDTITLYINPRIQKEYYEYLLKLKPRRIIFNPGTENPEFEKMAIQAGIETLEACTLVLLRLGQY